VEANWVKAGKVPIIWDNGFEQELVKAFIGKDEKYLKIELTDAYILEGSREVIASVTIPFVDIISPDQQGKLFCRILDLHEGYVAGTPRTCPEIEFTSLLTKHKDMDYETQINYDMLKGEDMNDLIYHQYYNLEFFSPQ